MNNAVPLFVILLVMVPAVFVGQWRVQMIRERAPLQKMNENEFPNKGSVEILNGCGKSGIGDIYSSFLRKNRFDVKSTGNVIVRNSTIWNFSKTLVISRKKDMQLAQEVATLLQSEPPVFITTDYNESDVTVIIGHDYGDFTNDQEIPARR